MRNLLWVVGWLVWGATAWAGERLPNGSMFHEFRLANGLRLLVVERHEAPVLTFQAWVGVGSRDEKSDPEFGKVGLAHFFEHLMFRGTHAVPDGEFDRILTRNGVNDENATTWVDRTNYYESVPSEKLDLVMRLEADRLVNLDLTPEVFETERGAVLGELHMGQDDPDSEAYRILYETAFSSHPYRYSVIGVEEELRSLTLDDAGRFYRKYYSPSNVTLLIVGDVDPAAARRLAEQHYGGIPSRPVERPEVADEPPQRLERQVSFEHRGLVQQKLLVGYRSLRAGDPYQAALQLVQAMLTLGEGSVLRSAWVNSGLASSIGGGVDEFRDRGLVVLSAEMQPGKTPSELIQALDGALVALMTGPSLARELERARNQLLRSIYSRWDDNSQLAGFMGEYIYATGDPREGFRLADRIQQCDETEVRRVLAAFFRPEGRTIVVGNPDSSGGGRR